MGHVADGQSGTRSSANAAISAALGDRSGRSDLRRSAASPTRPTASTACSTTGSTETPLSGRRRIHDRRHDLLSVDRRTGRRRARTSRSSSISSAGSRRLGERPAVQARHGRRHQPVNATSPSCRRSRLRIKADVQSARHSRCSVRCAKLGRRAAVSRRAGCYRGPAPLGTRRGPCRTDATPSLACRDDGRMR